MQTQTTHCVETYMHIHIFVHDGTTYVVCMATYGADAEMFVDIGHALSLANITSITIPTTVLIHLDEEDCLRYYAKCNDMVAENTPGCHILNKLHDGGAYGGERLELSYFFYPGRNVGWIPPPVVTCMQHLVHHI